MARKDKGQTEGGENRDGTGKGQIRGRRGGNHANKGKKTDPVMKPGKGDLRGKPTDRFPDQ